MDIEYPYRDLDDEWINDFERTDKLYEDFYKDDLYYINLRVIYVNRDNEIDKIKHESFLLTNKNNISREEILGILKKNSIDNERIYTLLSILRYNIILEPDDVKNYLLNKENNDYLSVIKNIDAINFEKSITMFHDLNDLILIFYEKSKEIIKKEQKNNTKKIFLRSLSTNRKTIKKRYKD
jgi:hypothetical protein